MQMKLGKLLAETKTGEKRQIEPEKDGRGQKYEFELAGYHFFVKDMVKKTEESDEENQEYFITRRIVGKRKEASGKKEGIALSMYLEFGEETDIFRVGIPSAVYGAYVSREESTYHSFMEDRLTGVMLLLFDEDHKKSTVVQKMNPAKYIEKEERDAELKMLDRALDGLRQGMFAPKNRGRQITETEEGILISENLLRYGFVADDEIENYPGVTHKVGIHPVMECTQNIPCNPCQDACPKGCISIGDNIVSLPAVVENAECINCGMCVASCSGQAIFLVNEDCGDGMAEGTIPYEFLPLPEMGARGIALGRNGREVCEAEIVSVKSIKAYDKTSLLTMKVPKSCAMKARFFKEA